ncbi:ComEC/Rec2 family competence protein [uncultured Acetobacteroides sp.]|uniref:ComEC/Rec2 family competence protein n=1 Tax=uncultured Acetobacteroides sp. TaxID=1760811 RepID=UPI0029F54781|nr:ComEC/Rec2 family competence protein [uncultured Acetobacteroides sp.]
MRALVEPLRLLPILKIAAAFSLGIAFATELDLAWYFWLLLSPLALPVMYWGYKTVRYSYRWMFGAGTFLLFFSLGAAYVSVAKSQIPGASFDENSFLTVQVDDNPVKTRYGCRWTSRVVEAPSNLKALVGTKAITYSRDTAVPDYAALLRIRGRVAAIDPPKNPYEFSFKDYYAHQGIYASVFVSRDGVLPIGKVVVNQMLRLAYFLQRYTLQTFRQFGFEGDELGVILALMIGDKQLLDGNLKTMYANIGAMHILAVSGMHVALYYLVLVWLLFFMRGRVGGLLKNMAILLALWVFAFVAGFSPSIVRATVMFTFILVGKMWNRSSNTYNMVAASFVVLLLYNPFSLYDVGFLLSYAAVFSILLFYPFFGAWAPSSRILRWGYDLVAVSLAAQILTLPLTVYFFHQLPLVFLLTNIILIPLTTLIIYGGLALLSISWWTWGAHWLAAALVWLLKLTNSSVSYIEHIPGAVLSSIYFERWQMLLLFVAFMLLFIFMLHRKPRLVLLSLTLMVAVASGSAFSRLKDRRPLLVVYAMRGGTAILMSGGECSYCLCDSVRDGYSYKFMDQSLLKWGRLASSEVRFFGFKDSLSESDCKYSSGWCSFRGKVIYVSSAPIAKKRTADPPVDVDYLIVCRKTRGRPEELLKYIRPRLVVIDGSASKYLAAKWADRCKLARVPFYSVSKKGAFVVNL